MDTIETPQETGPNESASNTEKIISNEKTLSVTSSPQEKTSEGMIQVSQSTKASVAESSSGQAASSDSK